MGADLRTARSPQSLRINRVFYREGDTMKRTGSLTL